MDDRRRELAAAHLERAERLGRYWWRRGGMPPDDEAESEARMALVRAAGSFVPGSGDFGAYLGQAVKRAVLALARKSRERAAREVAAGGGQGDDAERGGAGLGLAVAAAGDGWRRPPVDDREEAEAALSRLPPSQRDLLRRVAEQGQEAVALADGVSRGSIGQRVGAARRALDRAIREGPPAPAPPPRPPAVAPPAAPLPPMLSAAQTAGLLGVSKRTVFRLAASGALPPAVRWNRKLVRWNRDEVLAAIEAAREG